MLATTATRAATRAVARRGFHTTRAQQSSPYHYPEGPYTNLPFNTKTRFFAVRYWSFMIVGFGAPFGIAGAFFFFLLLYSLMVVLTQFGGRSLADVSSSLVSGLVGGFWDDGGLRVWGTGWGKGDGGWVYAMLRKGAWIGDTLSMSKSRPHVFLFDSTGLRWTCACVTVRCFARGPGAAKRNGGGMKRDLGEHGDRMVGLLPRENCRRLVVWGSGDHGRVELGSRGKGPAGFKDSIWGVCPSIPGSFLLVGLLNRAQRAARRRRPRRAAGGMSGS